MSEPGASQRESAGEERSKIAGRAGVVAAGTLLSRIFGLLRDIVLAATFNRVATDAWMIAFQIPNMLRQLLAEGAVQTAVLPVLSQVREKQGPDRARSFFQSLRGLSLLALCLTSALGIWIAPSLVELFAKGFQERPEQFELTTQLTRVAFPYIFFMGTAALGMAALNAHRRFVVTSFGPALLNVALIVCAFALPAWLVDRDKPPVLAMAIGALVGGFLQAVVQLPSLRTIGYARLPRFQVTDPHVREVLRRLGPTLLGVGVYYIDVIVGRRLLSELGVGAVTYYSYALRLCDFSQGIFIMALSTATLPTLSSFAARGEFAEVGETFAYSMRHALFIGIFATGVSVTLAQPIVSVLLERGQFGALAAQETSYAFMAQGMGIFLVAGVRQLVLVYFALGDTKTPVWIAMIDVVVFFTVSIVLRSSLGHVGVSLGVTAARLGQFGLLWWRLGRKLPSRHGSSVGFSALKTFAATAVASLGAFLAQQGLSKLPPALHESSFVQLIIGGSAFLALFIFTSHRLGSEELTTITEPIRKRVRNRSSP